MQWRWPRVLMHLLVMLTDLRAQGRKALVSKATAEQTEGPRVLPSTSPAASTLGEEPPQVEVNRPAVT